MRITLDTKPRAVGVGGLIRWLHTYGFIFIPSLRTPHFLGVKLLSSPGPQDRFLGRDFNASNCCLPLGDSDNRGCPCSQTPFPPALGRGHLRNPHCRHSPTGTGWGPGAAPSPCTNPSCLNTSCSNSPGHGVKGTCPRPQARATAAAKPGRQIWTFIFYADFWFKTKISRCFVFSCHVCVMNPQLHMF